MVVRIAGLAYQKGFGGHFHNDNALAALREIPGIVLMVPARADDAIALFRSACLLARRHRRVVLFVEPIALYHTRDLVDAGKAEWLASRPSGAAGWLEPKLYRPESKKLVIATFGNGVFMSLCAARRLEDEHGIAARVLDLRYLAPLPIEAILKHARETGRLLVVDETRHSGGPSEAILAACVDANLEAKVRRVTSADCFIPLGDAANKVLVSVDDIVNAARSLCAT
jgi:2-oxoisovalerate dehydrogenase E1 component